MFGRTDYQLVYVPDNPLYWHKENKGFNNDNSCFICNYCSVITNLQGCNSCGRFDFQLGYTDSRPILTCNSCDENIEYYKCKNCNRSKNIQEVFLYDSTRIRLKKFIQEEIVYELDEAYPFQPTKRESSFIPLIYNMRYNLLWYVPLYIWIVVRIVFDNAMAAYGNLGIFFHRFSWMILYSPSAYIYISFTVLSIVVPFSLLNVIPQYFTNDTKKKQGKIRYIMPFLIILWIYVTALVIQFIIWGSFPLEVDSEKYIRVRMIPFYPWPNRHFWQ